MKVYGEYSKRSRRNGTVLREQESKLASRTKSKFLEIANTNFTNKDMKIKLTYENQG